MSGQFIGFYLSMALAPAGSPLQGGNLLTPHRVRDPITAGSHGTARS